MNRGALKKGDLRASFALYSNVVSGVVASLSLNKYIAYFFDNVVPSCPQYSTRNEPPGYLPAGYTRRGFAGSPAGSLTSKGMFPGLGGSIAWSRSEHYPPERAECGNHYQYIRYRVPLMKYVP